MTLILSVILSLVFGAQPTTASTTRPETTYTIRVDTSAAPEMDAYGQEVQALSEEWYPKIVAMLPSEGFEAPAEVVITFDPDYGGVAEASGNRIRCSTKWFTERPEDLGAVIHELVHVVQQNGARGRPGWLVEGIADHVRFFTYEPEDARPNPQGDARKYDAAYRTSAAFLEYVQEKYNPDLVVELNAHLRGRRYDPEIWQELTGKSVEDLGAEWRDAE